MQRHDLYTSIHKAIRRRLFEGANRLELCDFSQGTSCAETLDFISETLGYLSEHAGHEDRFVQPLIAKANASLAERIERAHAEVDQAGKAVSRLVDVLRDADADTAMARGPELCHAFNVLVAKHLEHMNDEETLVNAAIWLAHSDEELREVHGALLASIAPERYIQWLHLLLPAINVHERIGMLGGMKMTAPPEVFGKVMNLGRDLLGEQWAPVERAMA